MRCKLLEFSVLLVVCAGSARGESTAERPPLDGAKPIATSALQSLANRPAANFMAPASVLYYMPPAPEDPLANYERTPLGDWPMPASVERGDPWLRLLLVGPKRPLVIDLAIFVDGKPFREAREAWIDEVLTPAKSEAVPPADSPKEEQEDGANAAAKEGTSPLSNDAAKAETSTTETAGNIADDSSGTNTSDEASEVGPAEGEDKKEKADVAAPEEKTKPVQTAGIPTQARQAPNMRDRLRNYLSTAGTDTNRDEIRWLIAEWGSGPSVLFLGPSLSWQRAAMSPLTTYLDRDRDGTLSATEIASVTDMLRRADADANDVVELSEIRRLVDRPAAAAFATDHSLIVPLDAETDWDSLAATFHRAYVSNGALASTSAESLRQFLDKPADVTLRVDFGKSANQTAGVSILKVDESIGDAAKVVATSVDVVSLDVGSDVVEFSAAEGAAGDNSDVSRTQIAVGAVIDGNPLERLLDLDNDQRLTQRERQALGGLLSALDRDANGAVRGGEMPVPIRFAVTLGPHVHQLLASPVGAVRKIALRDAAPAAPAWFASMDKNRDSDLSRGEFLGTSEQFRQFDADSDGLLSIQEAVKVNPGR